MKINIYQTTFVESIPISQKNYQNTQKPLITPYTENFILYLNS